MFDRISSNNTERGRRTVPARVTLADGSVLAGDFILPGHTDIASHLNGDRAFLAFALADGGQTFLARSAIARIDPVMVGNAGQLDRALRAADRFDPAETLGIAPGAAPDEVRAAYRARVRAYHPGRMAALDLPPEMVAYASAMLGRINAAYEQLRARAA